MLVIWSVNFFDKIKVDDPVGAISVHGANGVWGLLAVGIFSDGSYGQGWNGVGATDYLGTKGGALLGVTGLIHGDTKQFVAQVIEVVVALGWNVIVGGIAFWVVGKLVGGNRVSAEVELKGLDIPEMGAEGYPDFLKPQEEELAPAIAAKAV